MLLDIHCDRQTWQRQAASTLPRCTAFRRHRPIWCGLSPAERHNVRKIKKLTRNLKDDTRKRESHTTCSSIPQPLSHCRTDTLFPCMRCTCGFLPGDSSAARALLDEDGRMRSSSSAIGAVAPRQEHSLTRNHQEQCVREVRRYRTRRAKVF